MRIKSAIIGSTIGAMTLFGGTAMAAGSDSLSLGGGSYQTGSSFAVPVYVNTGTDPVNVVEAAFTYDTSAFQFESDSCGGAFGITANATANDLTCGVSGGASATGSQLVGTINFKALGSGSTVASIASGSHIYRSTDNTDVWDGVTTSTGFSFTSPAPAPTPVKPVHTTKNTTPAPVTSAPVAPTPTPTHKVTPKKSVTTHTKNAATVKSSTNGVYWALIALGVVALFFLLPTAWMNRHPKQSRIYKQNTKRFVKNNITNPTKNLYKHGVQFNPFSK